MARMMAMTTSLAKSFESKTIISGTLAPSTLRTPISLMRCSAANVANPNSPRKPIITARKVNPKESLPKTDSVCILYHNLVKERVFKGYSGEYFFVTASILANVWLTLAFSMVLI